MARAKGGADVNSAFDLFLDTISNAFGGIVFILLLVIVLLQLTGPSDAKPLTPEEINLQKVTSKNLEIQIAKMQALYDAAEADLKEKQAKMDPALFERYRKQKALEAELQAKLAAAQASAQDSNPQTLHLKIQELQKQIVDLGKQVEEAQKLADEATASKGKKSSSAASATSRQQVPLFIYQGNIIPLFDYDERGREGPMNAKSVSDVTKTIPADNRAEGVAYFMPKAGQGMPVAPTHEFVVKLEDFLHRFKPESHYIGLVVWPDSFAEYELVRNKIYELGFGYYVVIQTKDEPVATGGPAEEIRAK